MAYTRVYEERINWENLPSQNTAIDAENLNKTDYALYKHDEAISDLDAGKADYSELEETNLNIANLRAIKADQSELNVTNASITVLQNSKANQADLNATNRNVLNLQTTKANQSDLLLDIKSVEYNSSTGIWKFTHQNGTVNTFDQNIEKIPVSFSMSPQGIITMRTADGTTYTANIASLIKTYTFADTPTIDFSTVTDSDGNKTIRASVINGSITEQQLQPQFLSDCRAAVATSQEAAVTSGDKALDSEAWATGERNGIPISPYERAYHNNSKYYAVQASNCVTDAAYWAEKAYEYADEIITDNQWAQLRVLWEM